MIVGNVVELKDDDADDEEGDVEEGRSKEKRLEDVERSNTVATANANSLEKKPTGKIVGIIRRNWRA